MYDEPRALDGGNAICRRVRQVNEGSQWTLIIARSSENWRGTANPVLVPDAIRQPPLDAAGFQSSLTGLGMFRCDNPAMNRRAIACRPDGLILWS